MYLFRRSRIYLALLLAGFLSSILIRVKLWSTPVAFSIVHFYLGAILLVWALSVQKRVTDRRLRGLVFWIVGLILMLFMLQILRYDLITDENSAIRRLCWYAYYIPMATMPLACFHMSLSVHRRADCPLPPVVRWANLLCVLLMAGILTNDLHHLAFSSLMGAPMGAEGERHGIIIWLFTAYTAVLLASSFFIIIVRCLKHGGIRYQWLPALPLIWTGYALIAYGLNMDLRIAGVRLYQLGEIYCVGLVSFLECCIQVGLIPANMEYENLFKLAGIPAVILDSRGQLVYSGAGASYPFLEDDRTQIGRHPIAGGEVVWAVNTEHIQALNRQLEEAAQRMEARNAYLSAEYHIKKQRAEAEQRNRLYDQIYRIVEPQLIRIDRMLDGAEGDVKPALPKIAVLCAYVKRRSNMELIASEGRLPSEELATAVSESLEYIRLMGASAALTGAGSALLPAAMVTEAYECFERLAETCLDSPCDMLVSLRTAEGSLRLRMMLKAGDFHFDVPCEREPDGFSRKLEITSEGQDTVIVLSLAEEGRRAP